MSNGGRYDLHRSRWLQWLIIAVLLAIGVILLLLAGENPHGVVKSILRETGIVTIGTILVALVYEFVLRPEHDRQLLAIVRDSLISQAGVYGLSAVTRVNFATVFECLRPGDELCWLDTYCPDVSKGEVQEALLDALR
jgi:hypothetical protein